jgi:hypothetical protein
LRLLEGDAKRVADGFENKAVVFAGGDVQQGVMTRKGTAHRSREPSHNCVLPSMSVNRKVR